MVIIRHSTRVITIIKIILGAIIIVAVAED
jgi:hypothetical protein